MLAEIDAVIARLTPTEPDGGDVARLFGEKTLSPARRQPVFE
jgi:hypothetical protein